MTDPDSPAPGEDAVLCVRHHGRTYRLGPGEEFTFGRSTECTLCLDDSDLAISRLSGRIARDGGLWWIVNASSSRPLAVVDEFGLRSVLPPGHRRAAEGPVRVLVDGRDEVHEFSLDVPDAGGPASPDAELAAQGQPTSIGEHVVVNPADRIALVALFAGYLETGSRYDPNPKSYAAAAARLGWPRTTLVKRIEYLRARLSNAGVPNLTGPFALTNLAEYALTTGLIGAHDLTLLGR